MEPCPPLAVSNLHKRTSTSFLEVITTMYEYVNPKTGEPSPLVSDEVLEVVVWLSCRSRMPVQWDCSDVDQGGRKAEGGVCSVPRAVACRHL